MAVLRAVNERLPQQAPVAEKALHTYVTEQLPLHIRRTLDQYFYGNLRDTDDRDMDQVVTRYARYISKWPDPALIMVDQLWMFILKDSSCHYTFMLNGR